MKTKKLIVAALCAATALSTFAFGACGGDGDVVKIIDVKLSNEEYAFVIDKENTDLLNDFNAFFADYKESGALQAVMDKYFNNEGTPVGYPVSDGTVTNDADTFVVASNCPFEPFEYIGGDGKAYGVDIEIAAAYAESRSLDLVIKNIPVFDNIFSEVDSGYADVGAAGITVDAARAQLYNFSTTYYNATQKLIVAADNTDFDNCETAEDVEAVLAALTNKKIGYQSGTTGNWYIEGDTAGLYAGFANVTGKGYASAQDAVTDLINGNIYAVVVDDAPAKAIVAAFNK